MYQTFSQEKKNIKLKENLNNIIKKSKHSLFRMKKSGGGYTSYINFINKWEDIMNI